LPDRGGRIGHRCFMRDDAPAVGIFFCHDQIDAECLQAGVGRLVACDVDWARARLAAAKIRQKTNAIFISLPRAMRKFPTSPKLAE